MRSLETSSWLNNSKNLYQIVHPILKVKIIKLILNKLDNNKLKTIYQILYVDMSTNNEPKKCFIVELYLKNHLKIIIMYKDCK